MTKYREIIRMDGLGISGRSISASLECSRNTISEVLKRAAIKGIEYPLPADLSEAELGEMLFPERISEKAAHTEYVARIEHLHRFRLNSCGGEIEQLRRTN